MEVAVAVVAEVAAEAVHKTDRVVSVNPQIKIRNEETKPTGLVSISHITLSINRLYVQ